MLRLKIIFFISLFLGFFSLITASLSFNSPVLYGFIFFYTILYGIFRKSGASLFWIVSIIMSIIGFYIQANPILLFVNLAFSLVCWDLASLEKSLKNQKSDTITIISLRTKSILTVSFVSLGIILLVRLIQFDIPFYAMLIIALVILASLFKLIGLLKSHGSEIKE